MGIETGDNMTIIVYDNDLPKDFTLAGDIAIDTEAMGLNNMRDRLCVVQLSNGDGNAHLVKFHGQKYNAPHLKKLLENKESTKIFHFARFDVAIIMHYLNVEFANIYCTKIASYLVRTFTDSHSLKDLCKDFLGVQLSKAQRSSDWGAEKLTKEQQEYAANDVLYLHKIRAHLNTMLVREGRMEIAQKCFDFIPARAKLDLLGWNEIDIFSHNL